MEEEALAFQSFMEPMLNCYPERRVSAQSILSDPWLRMVTRDDELHM